MSSASLTRAERRRVRRRRLVRRRVIALLVLLAAVAAATWWAVDRRASSSPARHNTAHARLAVERAARPRLTPVHVVERSLGALSAAVQDAAAAPLGAERAILLGGLTASDTSTPDIRIVARGRERTLGRLPAAVHDAAAARLGNRVYLFGGGDGVKQVDQIVGVDPRTGATAVAGRLPAPSSDQAAAVVGGTAYVVGGFTGARWLDTIVAWRPGRPARVVAHLPTALRYAAVTAAAGKVVIAGGSLPTGVAGRAVYAFDPSASRIRPIGRLPAPTTHAAAAAIGPHALVIGGRGSMPETPTDRVVAVDPGARRVVSAGRLAAPASDLAAVGLGNRVLLAGGRSAGTTRRLAELVPARPSAHAARAAPVSTPVGNVYAYAGANMLSSVVRRMPPRVYVPNSASATVDVIDQRTFRIVAHYAVGALPQHVTPSYDLKTLYVDNDQGNSLTRLSPWTGRPRGPPIPVDDPYNLYFTLDGRYAIVVAERNRRLDFRHAHSMRLHRSIDVPCKGVDHMDFTARGRFALVSCEFSGQMLVLDVARERVARVIDLPGGGMPQDVKLSPDGRVFYVADMARNGVWEVDARRFRILKLMYTGRGAHGLYPSRDAKTLYVTNRGEGSITLIDFATRRIIRKWWVGGSPDMGGVSADGNVLWLSGRYNAQVYAISTRNGRVLARIPVGYEPHGLCVWPQPGRYSLGHTGVTR